MADLNQTTTVTLTVNGKQAEQKLKDLTDRARQLHQQMEQARRAGDNKTYGKLQKELQKTNREAERIRATAVNVEKVLQNINGASLSDLEKTLKTLQREFRQTEQNSPRFSRLAEAIRNVKTQIQQVKDETNAAKQTLQDTGQQTTFFDRIKKGFHTVRAAIDGVKQAHRALLSAVQPYADMEEQMAETRKFTGMTTEEVRQLNEAFKQMDTRTSREQLNMLAQEAGRLGKNTKEDVLGYVEAADIIHVALSDLGEDATETVYKIASIFHLDKDYSTRDMMLAVGSAVNTLSQNSVVSSNFLVEFSQRMAGVGATAKLSVPDILAYASTLSSAGMQVEQSSSALGRLTMKLFQDPAKMARAAGLDVKQFTDTLKRDTNEALLMFLERIHELGQDGGVAVLAPMFKDMGANGVGLTNVLTSLADNIDMVRAQQQAANEAFNEGTSAMEEFAIGNNTVQARLDKHKKELREVAVAFGEKLLPVMDAVIRGTTSFIKVITATGKFLKQYGAYTLSLVAGLTAYTVVVKASAIAEGIHTAAIRAKKVAIDAAKRAQLAFNAATKANVWGLIAAAIAAVIATLAVYRIKLKQLTAEQKLHTDIQKQVNKQYSEEKGKIDLLNKAVHDETRSLADRRKALNELRAIVPGYHAELTDEGKLINDNKKAIEDYCTALKAQMALQAYQDRLQEVYNRRAELDLLRDEQEEAKTKAQTAYDKARKDYVVSRSGALISTAGAEEEALNAAKAAFDKTEAELTETAALIDAITKKIDALKKGSGNSGQSDTPGTHGQSDTPGTHGQSGTPDDTWRKRELALNEIYYQQDIYNHDEYTRRKLEIERDWQKDRMQAAKYASTEYLEAQAAFLKADQALQENHVRTTIDEENRRYQTTQRILRQSYADGETDTRTYQAAMETAELDHLRALTYIYKENTPERLKAQTAYEEASLRAQEKHAAESRRIQDQLLKDYFASPGTRSSSPASEQMHSLQQQNLDLLRDQLLAHAQTKDEELAVEAAYQEARYQLARKYNDRMTQDEINAYRAAGDAIVDYLNSEQGRQMTSAFEKTVSAMSGIFSQLSSYIDAETQLQTADIENRYDREIAAAGDNADKVAQLEEQKQADIAKIKNEASEKQFKMQVFTALAEGAMAAVSAWKAGWESGIAGPVLAPLFMALSLAQTGIQIAALQKQKAAAAATGYAEGGYTKKGGKYEPAGIVHAGEWVASQELLANPRTAAVIAALDQAQRTNTIGSLGAAVVQRSSPASIDTPASLGAAVVQRSSPASTGTPALTDPSLARALHVLTRRLNEPFVTVNTIEGDRGIKRAQDRYNRLTKNR